MAPIEKDPVPAARSASSFQPVALENPVTITGACPVEGSEKRELFSESAKTVLVFPRGTVIRASTALVVGQRVLLFNNKTRKEVVCQVVKSSPVGSANRFVELQFMEPIPGFWDFLIPTAPSASSTAPTFRPPAKPTSEAPPLPDVTPGPPTRESVASASPAPPIPGFSFPQTGTAPAAPAIPSARVLPKPAFSTPALLRFSKEIEAHLAGAATSAQVPAETSTPNSSPASTMPSVEQLKLLTARLRAELSSLHSTSIPAAQPSPPAPSATRNAETPASRAAKTFPEMAQGEPKPVIKSGLDSNLAGRTPVPASLSAESVSGVRANSVESSDALVVRDLQHPQTDVSEERSLSESSVQPDRVTSAGSQTRLSLGLAAAALLVLGVGAGYFGQNHSTAPATSLKNPSSAVSPLPVVNSARVRRPATSFYPSKPSNSPNTSPVGNEKTPALENYPLAAPVINRAEGLHQAADDLPDFESNSASAGSDPLAVGGPVRHKGPAVPLPVGGELKPAQLLKSVHPAYPELARQKNISGNVQIDALIDASGNVAAMKAISGPLILQRAALDAVRLWKYSPALLDGAPTPTHLNVTVQFSALENSPPSHPPSAGSTPPSAGNSVRHDPNAPRPVGGELKPAQLLKSVHPAYPELARQKNISGNVQIDALIDASGNVAAVKALSGPLILQRAALDAVKLWKYSPALLDGYPTPTHLTVTVQFHGP
jgi:TonB family protein